MIILYKIIVKLNTIWKRLYQKSYIEICKLRGMKVGNGVIFIGNIDFGSEPYLIEIGHNTKITDGCKFINHDGAMYVIRNMEKYKDARNFGRIKIGNNCFIGNNCIILPSSKIGNNCILGAGSVLNSSMLDNSVYAGVPAKFICSIDEYGEKALKNNTIYPRDLENVREKLDNYISKNLPFNYRDIK